MGKLSRADAGSSGKLRMWAVGRQRLALRAVDVDFPGVIYCKSSKWASDGTGESQFADRIEKEEYPLARPVTLAGVPQAGPLTNCENLSGANPLNGLVHTKGDLREGDRVLTRGRSLNFQYCSGEDVSGAASELINVIDQSARPALRNRENRRQEQEAGDGNVSTETSHRIPL